MVADFEKIDKLKDPEAKPPLSLTQYEKYIANKQARSRTRGAFQVDPERIKVVKHPAEFQVKEYRDLLSLNQQLKTYLEKGMALEDKKMHLVHKTRIYSDTETRLLMDKNEKKFIRQNKLQLQKEWQQEPRF